MTTSEQKEPQETKKGVGVPAFPPQVANPPQESTIDSDEGTSDE